jgi:hypothetical protein
MSLLHAAYAAALTKRFFLTLTTKYRKVWADQMTFGIYGRCALNITDKSAFQKLIGFATY